jgi:hypothetical protein
LANSNFQGNLSIENTATKNIPSWGVYNAQTHAYSTYYSGNISYAADTYIEIVLNGCRWGWGNLTIPDSITIYAHNSYLRGNITNNGVIYLRNSQCQLLTGGGSVIYQNKTSQLQNDSNFASYNDTLFFQVSNTDTIYSDTSITADTQMDVTNDTSCFIIYGVSYNITLTDFDYSYKINVSGYWCESSQLVYLDEVNNRIVFKADINTFAPNTIKFNVWRIK